MNRYHVSYVSGTSQKDTTVYGSAEITLKTAIRSYEDIERIKKMIHDGTKDLQSIVIICWQRFEEE
jgi:hypothetical protein